MIYGIGIDIVRIDRIEKAINRWGERFLSKVFGQKELAYIRQKKNPAAHLSARFAAKEALFKALGCGWSGGVTWVDIEVERNSSGKPELVLSGKTKEIAAEKGITSILLTLSHDSEYAMAQVLLISQNKESGRVWK